MGIVRFFFGSGWWVLWYLAFYVIVLLFVVLMLAVFGQEVKPPGEKPNPASPASIMVYLIALTLGFLTLINAILFASALELPPWYVKILFVLATTGAVVVVGCYLNTELAVAQSVASLRYNIVYAALVILGNLVMMWFVQNKQ